MTDEEKARIIEYDKAHVWHPFTQMKEWVAGKPMVIEKGEGNYIYDIDGKKYLDAASSIWCNIHGHRKKELDAALVAQSEKIAHSTFLGLTHPTAAILSKRLADILPGGLNKIFYSDSGSEAVEIALKMAFMYWKHKGDTKRTKFLAFKDSYHGDTIGSVSVGGIETFHSAFRPLLFDTVFVTSPFDNADKCIYEIETELKNRGSEYAGVIIEPLVQGACGIQAYSSGVVKQIREITEKYNVLMIADEVATGFGRTGKMFACEHEDVVPDIMCLAKGITGGYLPLAATVTTDDVYNAYYDDFSTFKTFFHGHTYTANPLACAVAIASLDVFENENVLENVTEKSVHLRERLSEIEDHPHVGSIRLRGLMGGVEIVKNRSPKEAYDPALKMGYKICDGAIERGVWIRPLGNVVVLMPPLSITHEEIDVLSEALKSSIMERL